MATLHILDPQINKGSVAAAGGGVTVCSDRLIRTRRFPEALASAATKLVLPTPGEPSSKTGLCSFRALRSRWALTAVVPAAMA